MVELQGMKYNGALGAGKTEKTGARPRSKKQTESEPRSENRKKRSVENENAF